MVKLTNSSNDHIANTCASTKVESDHALLLKKIQKIYPELTFLHVLTRGGWHRPGNVVAETGEYIARNLRVWLESESSGDINTLIDKYAGSGYVATRYIGKTHYFVAQTGMAADEFVQLEIEELQEELSHKLFDKESAPDDLEDFIEPLDAQNTGLENDLDKSLPEPSYAFRRITYIADFLQDMTECMVEKGNRFISVERFLQDWDRSSAKESGAFCHHWVISLQEYTDAWGEPIMRAKPVSTYTDKLPIMRLNGKQQGSKLANLIHGVDHDIGYPMAWYFFMLSHSEVPHQLAEAIHKDLMGAYDYLPARDLKVLKDWSVKPYGI